MLTEEIVRKALQELADFVKKTLEARIDYYGYNPRAKKNTLKGSKLEKSIKVTTAAESLSLEIADYWEYVACGWARSHRFSGTYPNFVTNIIRWVREKHIKIPNKTDNQIAFMFFKFFTENGIVGRPFMFWNADGDLTKMIPELKDEMDRWCDELFDKIMKETDNYFNG